MEEMYFSNEKEVRKYKIIKFIKTTIVYLFLAFFAIFTLLPFYWMIVTSFKSNAEIAMIDSAATFFPQEFTWENYTQLFDTNSRYIGLFRFMLNTIIVGVVSTFLTVVVTILAAFAFARLSFKGKELIFSILLSTMMIPGEMMIITNFTTVANLGWLNSYTALIVPFISSVFYTFFLRQNFKQIPDELYYAAKVDGVSDFGYLFKVMLPIAKPAIITITILSLIGSWNAYIWPRTVTDGNMRLVTDGIMSMFRNDSGAVADNQIMAAVTLVSLPLLIMFILFKKYIMRGVSRAGIKG